MHRVLALLMMLVGSATPAAAAETGRETTQDARPAGPASQVFLASNETASTGDAKASAKPNAETNAKPRATASTKDSTRDNPKASPKGSAVKRYPPTGQILNVDGTRIHAHVEGRGPTVILIHGASGNTRDMTFDLVRRLARSYRVIAFDRPGLGHSDRLHRRGESPSEQAAVLDKAAAQLGVGRAVIVGHSYGGAVAMAWALDYPQRVGAVVSLAGATMPWEGNLGPWYRIASTDLGGSLAVPAVSVFLPRRVARKALDDIFAPQRPPQGYGDYVGLGLTLRVSALQANAKQVNGLKSHVAAMARRYPRLTIPVEVLHGTSDGVVSYKIHAQGMAALLPNAKLTLLPGIGHMPHHADPKATVAVINRAARRAGLR